MVFLKAVDCIHVDSVEIRHRIWTSLEGLFSELINSGLASVSEGKAGLKLGIIFLCGYNLPALRSTASSLVSMTVSPSSADHTPSAVLNLSIPRLFIALLDEKDENSCSVIPETKQNLSFEPSSYRFWISQVRCCASQISSLNNLGRVKKRGWRSLIGLERMPDI